MDAEALLAAADAEAVAVAERSFLGYLRYVVISSRPEPRRFGLVAEPWQWDLAHDVAPALMALAGLAPPHAGPLSFWHEYGKGHDKTTRTARTLNWLLAFSGRPLFCYACAGDRDQAGLIRDAMRVELDLNPWLAARVDLSNFTATGASGSKLEILATDSASAQGKFPDFVVCEEITHWKHASGREFWDSMVSAINKRPGCILQVNTNAGFTGSWQWDVRKVVLSSPNWVFRGMEPRRPLASWMDAKKIAEDRKLLMPTEARRLLDNEWIDMGEESGYLTEAECLARRDPNLREQRQGKPGTEYVLVLDYGRKKDRAALCVMHQEPGGRVDVDRLDCWAAPPGGEVKVDAVEQWVWDRVREFPFCTVVADPYQLVGTIQRLAAKGVRVKEFEYKAGKNNYLMAQVLQELIQAGRIRWYDGAGYLPGVEDDTLEKELAKLVLVRTSYGYRFDHESSQHDDRAVVLAMGSLHATGRLLPEAQDKPPPAPPVPTRPAGPLSQLGQLTHAAGRGLYGLR